MKKDEMEHVVDVVFRGENGKKFDEILRRICMADVSVYNDNPQRNAYNSGKRDVYIMLKSFLKGGINGREFG